MWIGELITQRGIGNGMSLIIFANIMAGLPQAIFSSTEGNAGGIITMVIICAIILLVIPLIVFLERGQRRSRGSPTRTDARNKAALLLKVVGRVIGVEHHGGVESKRRTR